MSEKRRKMFIEALIGLMVILFVVTAIFNVKNGGRPSYGRAKDFKLESLNGTVINLKDYRDKIVLLDFFATWCGPCKAATPEIAKVHKEYKDKVVIFTIDIGEDAQLVREYVENHGVD